MRIVGACLLRLLSGCSCWSQMDGADTAAVGVEVPVALARRHAAMGPIDFRWCLQIMVRASSRSVWDGRGRRRRGMWNMYSPYTARLRAITSRHATRTVAPFRYVHVDVYG